jgi:hypothetical protein
MSPIPGNRCRSLDHQRWAQEWLPALERSPEGRNTGFHSPGARETSGSTVPPEDGSASCKAVMDQRRSLFQRSPIANPAPVPTVGAARADCSSADSRCVLAAVSLIFTHWSTSAKSFLKIAGA